MEMRTAVRGVLRMLGVALRGMTIGWILAIVDLLRRYLVVISRRRERRGGPRKPRTRCLQIPADVYQRADPQIYSQAYLMSLGMAVTWNNPDIWIEQHGVRVASNALAPDTDSVVHVRVWNGSFRAPAIGLPVRVEYAPFSLTPGATLIGTTRVDLPVRGAPGHPVLARIPWRTPAMAGHYCVTATLLWGDDENPVNNVGQENTDIVRARRGTAVIRSLILRNRTRRAAQVQVSANAYALPAHPRVVSDAGSDAANRAWRERPWAELADPPGPLGGPDGARRAAAIRAAVVRENALDAFPIPPAWAPFIDPQEIRLEPDQERIVSFAARVPETAAAGSRVHVNLYAVDAGSRALMGGVTIIVEVE